MTNSWPDLCTSSMRASGDLAFSAMKTSFYDAIVPKCDADGSGSEEAD